MGTFADQRSGRGRRDFSPLRPKALKCPVPLQVLQAAIGNLRAIQFQALQMPPFNKVINRVAVIFDGAEPVTVERAE